MKTLLSKLNNILQHSPLHNISNHNTSPTSSLTSVFIAVFSTMFSDTYTRFVVCVFKVLILFLHFPYHFFLKSFLRIVNAFISPNTSEVLSSAQLSFHRKTPGGEKKNSNIEEEVEAAKPTLNKKINKNGRVKVTTHY